MRWSAAGYDSNKVKVNLTDGIIRILGDEWRKQLNFLFLMTRDYNGTTTNVRDK